VGQAGLRLEPKDFREKLQRANRAMSIDIYATELNAGSVPAMLKMEANVGRKSNSV
jgi:hypothetical protein